VRSCAKLPRKTKKEDMAQIRRASCARKQEAIKFTKLEYMNKTIHIILILSITTIISAGQVQPRTIQDLIASSTLIVEAKTFAVHPALDDSSTENNYVKLIVECRVNKVLKGLFYQTLISISHTIPDKKKIKVCLPYAEVDIGQSYIFFLVRASNGEFNFVSPFFSGMIKKDSIIGVFDEPLKRDYSSTISLKSFRKLNYNALIEEIISISKDNHVHE